MPIKLTGDYNTTDSPGSLGQDKFEIKRRVSHGKKIYKGKERQKEIMDVYIDYYTREDSEDRLKKFDMNYDLLNGRLDVNLYKDEAIFEIEGEKIKFDTGPVTHFPFISQIANAYHGEVINRTFKPLAKDISPMANTLRDKKWNSLIEEYLQANVVAPIEQKVTQQFMSQISEQDMFNMTPEQQMEIKNQIDNEVKTMTPEAMVNFMENEYKVPTEQAAQMLLNHEVEENRIRYKTNEGAKHAIAVGEEYYHIGIVHDKPVLTLVNPKYLKWGGSRDTEWIQDATWVTYEKWLTYEDATQKYAEVLEGKDYKELENLVGPIGRYSGSPNPDHQTTLEKKVILEVSMNEEKYHNKFGSVNTRTKEGQSKLKRIYAAVAEKYGHEYGFGYANYGIREVHVVWRDKRKLWRVERLVDGETVKLWLGENYTKQPQDLSAKAVWVDELWEGTRLGTSTDNAVYVNVRPLPNQYRSLSNPFHVEMPYYGKKYRTHQNNSKNVSIVDLGKPWQKEFDTEMTSLKRDLKTNVGSVFVTMMSMKPDNWKWQDWLGTMKHAGLLMVDPHKNGLNSLDPQMMRSINIGKVSDIVGRMQLLEFYRSNLIQAMHFNPARIGAIGQYTTQKNIEASTGASYNQTEGFFETHREIVERAITALLNTSKMVYKKNPERIKHIFDDVTYTDYVLSPDFWYSETGIYFKNSAEELRQIEALRGRMLEFIQNGMSFEGILGLTLVDTRSEMTNLMRKETNRLDRIRQEQQQAAQQAQQAQIQATAEEAQQARNFDYMKHKEVLESQERRTVIQADQWRKQFDVNQDGENDQITKTNLELALKKAIENRKLDIEEEKLKILKAKG